MMTPTPQHLQVQPEVYLGVTLCIHSSTLDHFRGCDMEHGSGDVSPSGLEPGQISPIAHARLRRDSSSVSDDYNVQMTCDDATECKRFAIQTGYWHDPYLQFFFHGRPERKEPEINRGYWARVKVVRMLIQQFLEVGSENSNFGGKFQFWREIRILAGTTVCPWNNPQVPSTPPCGETLHGLTMGNYC